ncbi:MAG: radical SAM protein [Bacillota bacterium]
MLTFGPVPSRRLGRSLGINNIPPKMCSYACVYCQLGRTPKIRADRAVLYDPARVVREVQERVARARAAGEAVDYLTFVPDGEPTLDANLGEEIERVRRLGLPVAVITNASLLWREDVRRDLLGADWVSLKVDAATGSVWRRVNRPHGELRFDLVLRGILDFAARYGGVLTTETMLVGGLNDYPEHLEAVAALLAQVCPRTAYLAVPTRPPAEKWVRAPGEDVLHVAYQILAERLGSVEFLTGYEGDAFVLTGRAEDELLSITSVHPMREDAVASVLARAGSDWSVVQKLVEEGLLVELSYGGKRFYVRKLPAGPAWDQS